MNERQLYALDNPCHSEEEMGGSKFEFREELQNGKTICAELRVVNYFGMMTWFAAAAALDDAGEELAIEQLGETDRAEIKTILRGLLEGVGTTETDEAEDEKHFLLIREVSPAELARMPRAPFAELLNVKKRQTYALRRPPQNLEDFLTGDYKLILKFGGTTYSTMLTVENSSDPAAWHASVSILSDSLQPMNCFKVRKTEFEQAMTMMNALLEGVGTGKTWTNAPTKTGTAFHLYRKLSEKEKQKFPPRFSFDNAGNPFFSAKKFGH